MRIVSIIARFFVTLAAVAVGVSLAAGGADGAQPVLPSASFFELSRIEAVSVPAESATRLSVTLSGVHANDAPTFSWYLQLARTDPASVAGVCSNVPLSGGKRLSARVYRWVNQTSSFLWYHGPAGAYPADRSYGCNQAAIGRAGYPGTVTLVVENEYQHCTASFTGLTAGSKPAFGPPASCALGGYSLSASMLPVPAALLALYRSFDTKLGAIVGQARQSKLTGAAALTASLDAILAQQSSAYERLFPPVWGCSFAGLFHAVVVAQTALDTQIAVGAAGARAALADDSAEMRDLAHAVASCAQSPTNSGGAPRAVVEEVDRLSAQTAALRAQDASQAGASPLDKRIAGIDDSLNSLVSHAFPTVFGMPFIGLVEKTLGISAAAALAERDAAAGKSGPTLAALEGILGPEQATSRALVKQQKRVIRAENKNA